MLLEKPTDVRHSNSSGRDCAIYGIDAHPNALKFATAGGDNCVKVWSLETIPEKEGPGFELLATLAWHEQAVNCVRWSHNGRYLASGSDDHLVLLYELQDGPPAPIPFGSNQVPNKEKWVRCAMLKNHTMDVQDVAWSPDDRMLATCSIDNSILIWSMDQISSVMTHPIQHLSGHNGWVKGVAWDPYLSSAGEDKCIIMWRVDTWEKEEKIEAPFEQGTTTSHFRRLSWAPDGSMVCGTHAFKSRQDVAALIERKTWKNEVDFVGHQGVVTTARFNPRLVAKTANKEFACCALGGDDCTVSVWLADVARPLAVVKGCFDASVTDLSWSYDGFTLLSASLDGTICFFQFSAEELGNPITPQQQNRLLQQKYGSLAGLTSGCTLAENPMQLELEGQHKESAMDKLAKRITPTSSNPSEGSLDQSSSKEVFTLVARSKSKKDIGDASKPNEPAAPIPPVVPAASTVTMLTARPKVKKSDESKANGTSSSTLQPNASEDDDAPILKRKRIETTQKQSQPAPTTQKQSQPAPTTTTTHLIIPQDNSMASSLPEIPSRTTFTFPIKSTEKILECKVVEEGSLVYSAVSCVEDGTVKWMDRFPGLVVCMTGNQTFCAFGTSEGHLFILSPLGRRLFPCIALGYSFSAMESSPQSSPYLLVILTNGDVKSWIVSGKKCLLKASLCGMTTSKSTLLRAMVTATGQPIVTLAVSTSTGNLLHSFTYDLAMECWMRVADDSFSYSDFQSHLTTDAVIFSEIPVGTLRRLQNASTHSRPAKTLLAGTNNAVVQHHITRTHLEHQVASTVALQSSSEFLHWLKVYARHLSHDGDIPRLEEICKDLLGPMSATESTRLWTSHILDKSKRELLQTIMLPQMATNRVLQRLVQKYQLLLDEIEKQTADL